MSGQGYAGGGVARIKSVSHTISFVLAALLEEQNRQSVRYNPGTTGTKYASEYFVP